MAKQQPSAEREPRPPARTRILRAAASLMSTSGVGGTTTKEIARAAECSEAALYKYFRSKEELFVCLLREHLTSPLLATLDRLATDPGDRDVREQLTDIAAQAVLFYRQSFPLAVSLFADSGLLRRHGESLGEIGAGPHLPIEQLERYLRGLRDADRISPTADTYAAAALLLGACAQRAFAYDQPGGAKAPQSTEEFAAALAVTLLNGIN